MNTEKLESLFERQTEGSGRWAKTKIVPEHYVPHHPCFDRGHRGRSVSPLTELAWAELSTDAFIEKLADYAWRAHYGTFGNGQRHYSKQFVSESSIQFMVKRMRRLPPPETDALVFRIKTRAQALLDNYCNEVADRVLAAIGPVRKITTRDATAIKNNLPAGIGQPVVEILKDRFGQRRRCALCGRTDHNRKACPQGTEEAGLAQQQDPLEATKQRLAAAESLLRRVSDPELQKEIQEFLAA